MSFLMGLFLPHTMEVDGAVVNCAYITQWSQVADASWFSVPKLMPVALQFDITAIIPMCIMFIVTAVETIGDTSGVMQGGLTGKRQTRNSPVRWSATVSVLPWQPASVCCQIRLFHRT